MNRGTVRDGKRSEPRKSSSSASFHGDLVIAAGKTFFTFDIDFYSYCLAAFTIDVIMVYPPIIWQFSKISIILSWHELAESVQV